MKTLRDELIYLKTNHSLVGIKGGTEVEAMSFKEILYMRRVSQNIIPMTVKIGGPEARNDIDYMLSIGVNRILAPMVESVYGLSNFVTTIEELDKSKSVNLAINLETITGYQNLESITRCPHFFSINQVTVGRTDLSASMEKNVDDKVVNEVAREIVELSKSYNKLTCVGGKINPINAQIIKDAINPDFINTRNMVLNTASTNISNDVNLALLWEQKFYQYLMKEIPSRKKFYMERIDSVIGRFKDNVLLLKN